MTDKTKAIPEGTVTLLSTDLVGSTLLNQKLGDELASAIERQISSLALDRVAKYGGVVVKDTGDGLMAAFRSARRAVFCAQELQREMSRRNRNQSGDKVELRIGLHTGEILAENGGLQGETVIIVKRIEEIAQHSGILASETVHAVLGTIRSMLEDRGNFNLKGITSPWHLYEVPWKEEAASKILDSNEPTPFIERSNELARLMALAERAKESSGSMVLIAGEAGVGKSRLIEEFAVEARKLGLLVLIGHCLDMEGAPPYQPIIENMERTIRIVDPKALREALGENAPEVAKLLPELRQRYPDIPEPVALPPEQERRYLLHGMCEFIERGARVQPMILVHEDLHWADESTLQFLYHIAQRVYEIPVLVLGTYRHTELIPGRPFSAALPNFLRQRLAEEVILSRFTEKGVAEVIKARAGVPPPSELISLIFSETEGNPYFVEELFRHLNDAGKLFDDEGRFKLGIHIADTEVPRGVRLIISQRLQNLSEHCRRMLNRVAALGSNFDFNLITALADLNEDALLDALDEAEQGNIIKDVSKDRDVRYAFVHEQIRQTLLSELSTPRLQRLHLRIANILEEFYGAYVENHITEIAHHLYQAGAAADGVRTARYLILAGEKALKSSAYDETIQLLDAAETVLPSNNSAMLAHVYFLQGKALRGSGQMERALSAFQNSIDLLPSGEHQDQAIHERAKLLLDLYRGHDAVHDLERLLSNAKEFGDRPREIESLLGLGRAYYIISLNESGGGERALESYEKAYKIAEEIGNKKAMVRALIPTHNFVDYWIDFGPKAVSNIEKALQLAEETGDEELIIDSTQARLRFLTLAEANAPAEMLLDRLRSRRDPVRLKEHYFFLMWYYLRIGDFLGCVNACDSGTELAEQLGAQPVQYSTIKALALMNLAKYDEAWEALHQEITEEPFGQAMQQYGMAFYLMDLLAFQQAEAQARKVAQKARELDRAWMTAGILNLWIASLAQSGTLNNAILEEIELYFKFFNGSPSRRSQAEVLLFKGNPKEALKIIDDAISSSEESGYKVGHIQALELKLRILLELKNMTEALSLADEALLKADQISYRSMIWRILVSHSRAHSALGDQKSALEDKRKAAILIREISNTISDRDLRQAFLENPITAQTLSV